MSQSYTAFSKNLGCFGVHHVTLIIYDLADANLCNLHAACQARACIAIKNRSRSDTISACFEERVLLGVQAEAGGKVSTPLCSAVAPWAYDDD